MAASASRAMSSTQCATTPSLHALHNTPMKLLFVRVALVQLQRSEERRVGKECRSRRAGYDLKKKIGFKPRQPHATRVHDLHAAHRQAPARRLRTHAGTSESGLRGTKVSE